jgi:hypothetical protein
MKPFTSAEGPGTDLLPEWHSARFASHVANSEAPSELNWLLAVLNKAVR